MPKGNINGICGKKLKQCFGRKQALIILNGKILLLAKVKMNSKNSQYFLNMIQILQLYKQIFNKEKLENRVVE